MRGRFRLPESSPDSEETEKTSIAAAAATAADDDAAASDAVDVRQRLCAIVAELRTLMPKLPSNRAVLTHVMNTSHYENLLPKQKFDTSAAAALHLQTDRLGRSPGVTTIRKLNALVDCVKNVVSRIHDSK